MLQTLAKPVRDCFIAFLFPLQRTFGRKRNQNQRGSFKDGVFVNQIAHGLENTTAWVFLVVRALMCLTLSVHIEES